MSKQPSFYTFGLTAIYGSSGSGKSTLMREQLMPQLKERRLVVIDPAITDKSMGHRTAKDALQALYDGSRKVVLNTGDPAQALPLVSGAFRHSHSGDPVYLICDECSQYFREYTREMQRIAEMARHKRFGMALLTQRPTNVHTSIRTQARTTFWMALQENRDIQVARAAIGHKLADRRIDEFAWGEFIQHPPVSPEQQSQDIKNPASNGSY